MDRRHSGWIAPIVVLAVSTIAVAGWDSGGAWDSAIGVMASGSTTPGGSTTQVQYNDAGTMAGDSGLTFTKATDALTVGGPLTANSVNSTLNVSGGNFYTTGTATVGSVNSTGGVSAGNLYTTGKLSGALFVSTDTDGGTIAAGAQTLYRGLYTNTGASAITYINLPTAVAGYVVTFLVDAAQALSVNPADGDTIVVLTNASGDAVSSDATRGTFLTLIGVDADTWMPMGYSGAWADVN